MTEPARIGSLMSDSTEPDRMVSCLRCKDQTLAPGFVIEMVKVWNRQEDQRTQGADRRPNFIRYGEIVACARCSPIVRAQRDNDAQLEHATTDIYLRDLRAGRHNPETRAWLRNHGHAYDVIRILAEEGNRE